MSEDGGAVNGGSGGGVISGGISPPALFHKVKNQRSVLALAASDENLFSGTEGGDISVWSLHTYHLLYTIPAHGEAVLGLFLSPNKDLLFSCGGDSIVNVWCTTKFKRVYSIFSTYDVGDVFCVVYSQPLQTIYLGAQNTSIQWFDLSSKDSKPQPSERSHPSQRKHRFFDSKGPGGVPAPRQSHSPDPSLLGGQMLEIDKTNIVQYAHYGYVYCMVLCPGLEQDNRDSLITGGGDGTIKIWNIDNDKADTIQPIATLENGDNSVLTMALKNTVLYAGRLEGEINVWDLETRQLIQTVKAFDTDVLTLSLGHGFIFAGGANGHARIFERHRCKADWEAHEGLILASIMTIHNEKPYFVTGGNDDCVALWSLAEVFTKPPAENKPSNEQLVQSLSKFVSFRTVSSRPEYAEDCRQGASWLRNLFKRYGAATQMLVTEDNRNPIVLATFKGKKAKSKRILFYGHYDVVPAENAASSWTTPPFQMEGRDGYIYGRGVSDNKGPVLAAIYAVADLIAEQKLESDVVFLIEGEEESSSRGFEEAVKKNKSIIGPVDWVLVANSYWLDDDVPCLTYGLRGAIHVTLSVKSGEEDLHSGVNGSQLLNEPLKDLVTLLANLTGSKRRIQIPGFYDKVLLATKADETRYGEIAAMLPDSHTPSRGGLKKDGNEVEELKARWHEPSMTIHGFKTSGAGNSTVIPHLVSTSLSFRLVPNQSANEIQAALKTFLQTKFKDLDTPNELYVKFGHPSEPWLGDPDDELFKALRGAVAEVWRMGETSDDDDEEGDDRDKSSGPGCRDRKDALLIREGGSIPAIRFLEKEFDAPAAMLPCGQASDSAHLDNERFRLANLFNSRKIFRKVFEELPLQKS